MAMEHEKNMQQGPYITFVSDAEGAQLSYLHGYLNDIPRRDNEGT